LSISGQQYGPERNPIIALGCLELSEFLPAATVATESALDHPDDSLAVSLSLRLPRRNSQTQRPKLHNEKLKLAAQAPMSD
jgi:hypothetical protein